jgi:hypothetical protein
LLETLSFIVIAPPPQAGRFCRAMAPPQHHPADLAPNILWRSSFFYYLSQRRTRILIAFTSPSCDLYKQNQVTDSSGRSKKRR